MSKVFKVTYTVQVVQSVEVPDEEFEDFDYDDLVANLEDYMGEIDDIVMIKLDGKEFYF